MRLVTSTPLARPKPDDFCGTPQGDLEPDCVLVGWNEAVWTCLKYFRQNIVEALDVLSSSQCSLIRC